MDLTYTPEQQAFRAEARSWLAANVPAEPLPSFDTAEGFQAHRDGGAKLNGDGVAMDRREGVDWLQRAAVQGKPEAIADLETLARAGIIIMEGVEPDEGR